MTALYYTVDKLHAICGIGRFFLRSHDVGVASAHARHLARYVVIKAYVSEILRVYRHTSWNTAVLGIAVSSVEGGYVMVGRVARSGCIADSH